MSYQQPPSQQGYPQWQQQPNTQYQPWQGQTGFQQQAPQPMPPPNFQSYPPMMPPQMPQQPPKKKSKVGLVVGVVVAILVLGCIGTFAAISAAANHATTTLNTAATTITNSMTATTAPTTNQVAKVGQSLTVDGVSCTLTSVKTLSADEFTKPKPGNEFIVVHVKLNNTSQDEKDYNPFDFHVRSGSGNITDEEAVPPSTYTANNLLNSGKLSAGGTVEGDIVFQVPKGDHKAQMTWQPSFLGNAGDNVWNLGL